MAAMESIFVICPVRNCSLTEECQIRAAVDRLEKEGYAVHWPMQDTNQDDPIGDQICAQNRRAIESADLVAIWYNPDSKGTLFDIGIAWALRKPIRLLCPIEPTDEKSFGNVLLQWASD